MTACTRFRGPAGKSASAETGLPHKENRVSDLIGSNNILNQCYDDIVGSLGTVDFVSTLHEAAQKLGICDVFGFTFSPATPPAALVARHAERAQRYSRFYHHLDPMLQHLDRKTAAAETILTCRVGAKQIANSSYRDECFEKVNVAEKLCYVRLIGGNWTVLNLYRRRGDRDPDMDVWAVFARITLPLMVKHAGIVKQSVALSSTSKIEQSLRSRFPGLTDREIYVCARTIAGATAQMIADELKISKATVLTYRRRAYERLNVSVASQLVNYFDT
jgi:DNA-binding CsgD family transcriptional regulator